METKKCIHCRTEIPMEATVCGSCHHSVVPHVEIGGFHVEQPPRPVRFDVLDFPIDDMTLGEVDLLAILWHHQKKQYEGRSDMHVFFAPDLPIDMFEATLIQFGYVCCWPTDGGFRRFLTTCGYDYCEANDAELESHFSSLERRHRSEKVEGEHEKEDQGR